ncbi:MAG: dipeptidase [Chitinophagaceae bacterium]|nr:MAG: dipeptidase [Chitinophagaceae bacterium]
MQFPTDYFEKNKDKYLEELISLLKISSISADKRFKDEVFEAAEFVKTKMEDAGMENTEVIPTEGYPVVYGEKIIDSSLPTILVYGHYDVQPPDPYELWDSPPFEPVIKDGKIFARGASDDKGQMYMHIKAFELMQHNDSLPCNVKFIIEGEEEVGSPNLEKFTRQYKDKLASDVILISDTAMLSKDTPSITTGLRGLCYFEVLVTGPNRDLHSGIYGGAVANPINVLANIISGLMDENKKVTIPGFYDDVLSLSEEERNEFKRVPFSIENYKKHIGIADIEGEIDFSTLERASVRPTLDVNGIWGGYQGEGAKTVLPSKAGAKISMRLVPNQKPEVIAKLFKEYIEKVAPESVKVEAIEHHGGIPVVTPTDSNAYKAASMAMEKTFGKKPIPLRSGGSIPIVALFEEVLKTKTVLLGFGLDTDAIHSPNEHFELFNFYKGIETIPYFYHYFTELEKK